MTIIADELRALDLFMPGDFASPAFAQLFGSVVIVRFTSGVTALGTLALLGPQFMLTQSPQTTGFVDTFPFDVNDVDWIRQFPAVPNDLRYLERVADLLTECEASWNTDGRRIEWSSASGAIATLSVERANGSARFTAFLTLAEPDHCGDYGDRPVPETRLMQAPTDPHETAAIIVAFLQP